MAESGETLLSGTKKEGKIGEGAINKRGAEEEETIVRWLIQPVYGSRRAVERRFGGGEFFFFLFARSRIEPTSERKPGDTAIQRTVL